MRNGRSLSASFVLAAAGLLFSGCYQFATNQTPRVFGRGEYCAGMSANAIGVNPGGSRPFELGGQIYARAGLGGGFDIGIGYATPLGVRLDVKRQLLYEPLLVAASLEASYDFRTTGRSYPQVDPHFFGLHPLVILGNDNIWGGARSIFQLELTDSGDTRFHAYPGAFIGGGFDSGILPEVRVMLEAGVYVDPGLDEDEWLFYPSGGLCLEYDFWNVLDEN